MQRFKIEEEYSFGKKYSLKTTVYAWSNAKLRHSFQIKVQNESSRSWISGKNNSKRSAEIASVEVSKREKFLSITLAKQCNYFSIVTKKSSNYRVYIDGSEKQIWRRFYMRIAWLPFMFTTKYKIQWNNHGQILARSCSTDKKPTCKCTSERWMWKKSMKIVDITPKYKFQFRAGPQWPAWLHSPANSSQVQSTPQLK